MKLNAILAFAVFFASGIASLRAQSPERTTLEQDRQKLMGDWQAPREPLDDGWLYKSVRFGKGDFYKKGDHETMWLWVLKGKKVFDGTLAREQQEYAFGPLSEKEGKRFIEITQSKASKKAPIQLEYKFAGEKLVLKGSFKMEVPEIKGRVIDVEMTGDWHRIEVKKDKK